MSRTSSPTVWDRIETDPAQAAALAARATLMHAIREGIESWQTTQTEAARRLGITQPRLNALLRGRLDLFSLDALVKLAAAAGLDVVISVQKTA
jgi:predicted XRE-type DNA-binding protein